MWESMKVRPAIHATSLHSKGTTAGYPATHIDRSHQHQNNESLDGHGSTPKVRKAAFGGGVNRLYPNELKQQRLAHGGGLGCGLGACVNPPSGTATTNGNSHFSASSNVSFTADYRL